MVQVPQGSACIDAILCLEQGAEIVFVGACGLVANGGEVSVGRVVEASIATAFDGTIGQRTWPRPLAAPAVSVATVRSLADSSTRHDSLGADADCVDLETAWILAAGQVAGCPARALLAVTDTNREGAAFDTNLDTVLSHLHEAATVAQATW